MERALGPTRALAQLFVTLFALALFVAAPAQAEKRVALVIGNSAYKSTSSLANPKHDANDVAAALKSVGFEVIEGHDLDKVGMDRKIRDFANALVDAQVGVFFYAGHGLQVGGVNYLVPIDAQLTTATALDWEMVRLDLVQATMDRSDATTKILFLDACRDNPLARNLARAMGTRSMEIGRGLAAADTGVGTLISFSTQPGYVAADGVGRNSPFSGPLARRIIAPGDDLSKMLINVRNEVMQATNNKQRPWEHSSLTGQFYFKPPVDLAAGSVPHQMPGETEMGWPAIRNSIEVSVLDAYIRQFPDSAHAAMARQRRDQLSSEVAAASPRVELPAQLAAQPLAAAALIPRLRALTVEAERALRPKESFKECETCPEMVVVAAGHYTMGSPNDEEGREANESPRHKVTIGAPFAAGKFEVTFAEWDACVADGGCTHKPVTEWGRGRQPVMRVSWDDIANEYLPWLRRKTGKPYRLLTEGEWEYAARAWTSTPFSTGPAISTEEANFDGTTPYGSAARGIHRNKSIEVGSFEPNAFGLHDMHGNVWEWVDDCFDDDYDGAPTDGTVRRTKTCETRVVRGGSWTNAPNFLRSAHRGKSPSATRNFSIGFRVARTLIR